MRILFWSQAFWPHVGGVQVFGAQLVLALQARGCQFLVVAPEDSLDAAAEDRFGGIPVHRFPFWKALAHGNGHQFMEVWRGVASLASRFAPHLIHINSFSPSVLFCLHTHTTMPTPLLVSLHESLAGRSLGEGTLLGRTLRRADWITSPSAAVLGELRNRVPETIHRSSLIYNAIKMPLALEEPPLPGARRLLCLGRLSQEKGFDLALTALASIIDRFPELRLVIAGDGPARADLEGQAAALGLKGSVDFVGWVSPDDVPALMLSSTMVLTPSRREAFGLVALEAAMMARPVVATRVGGLPEIVIHRKTGLMIDPEDCRGLAEAISYLLERPDTARRMGRAASSRAEERFSWGGCVNAYHSLYRTIVKEVDDVDFS